jgi:hypothetical protein
MKMRDLFATISIIGLSCGALCAAGGGGASGSAQAAFERIKSLAGEWRGAMVGESKMPDAVVRYRVTSAGSAVEETIEPASPHEMITIYHLDGDQLMLTHYCAAGNQPCMVLKRKKSTADTLVFDFAGGTNFKSKKDGHMHGLRLRFTGPDAFVAEWEYWKEGKPASVEKFSLTRKQ